MEKCQIIRDLRWRCRMTQKEFAEYFGISKGTVESWEGGKRDCPDHLLNLMIYKLEHEHMLHD